MTWEARIYWWVALMLLGWLSVAGGVILKMLRYF